MSNVHIWAMPMTSLTQVSDGFGIYLTCLPPHDMSVAEVTEHRSQLVKIIIYGWCRNLPLTKLHPIAILGLSSHPTNSPGWCRNAFSPCLHNNRLLSSSYSIGPALFLTWGHILTAFTAFFFTVRKEKMLQSMFSVSRHHRICRD